MKYLQLRTYMTNNNKQRSEPEFEKQTNKKLYKSVENGDCKLFCHENKLS